MKRRADDGAAARARDPAQRGDAPVRSRGDLAPPVDDQPGLGFRQNPELARKRIAAAARVISEVRARQSARRLGAETARRVRERDDRRHEPIREHLHPIAPTTDFKVFIHPLLHVRPHARHRARREEERRERGAESNIRVNTPEPHPDRRERPAFVERLFLVPHEREQQPQRHRSDRARVRTSRRVRRRDATDARHARDEQRDDARRRRRLARARRRRGRFCRRRAMRRRDVAARRRATTAFRRRAADGRDRARVVDDRRARARSTRRRRRRRR